MSVYIFYLALNQYISIKFDTKQVSMSEELFGKKPQNQKSVMTLIFCKTNKESSFSIKLWVWKLTLHIPLWITKIFCMGGWGVLFNCRLQFFSRTTWQIFNKTWHKASLGKYLQVNNWLNPLPRKNNEQNSALFFFYIKPCFSSKTKQLVILGIITQASENVFMVNWILFKPWPPRIRKEP